MSKKATGEVPETATRRARSIAVLQRGINSEHDLRELIEAHDLDLAEDTITPAKGAVHASNCRNYIRVVELREKHGIIREGIKTLMFNNKANGNGISDKESALKQLDDMRKEIDEQINALKGGD